MDSAFRPEQIACEAILKSCDMSLSSEAIDDQIVFKVITKSSFMLIFLLKGNEAGVGEACFNQEVDSHCKEKDTD